MAKLTSADYDALSYEIVENYTSKGTPLTDSVYKIASEKSLLPDQVRQLAWQTNIKAHLDLFKSAEDKVIEFPLADADSVIGKLFSDGSLKKEASVSFSDPNAEEDFFGGFYSPPKIMEKVASETVMSEREIELGRQYLESRLKLASDHFGQEVLSRRTEYIEAVEDLSSEIRKLATADRESVSDFIQEALTRYGEDVTLVLADAGLTIHAGTEKRATFYDPNEAIHQKLATAKNYFDATIAAIFSMRHTKEKLSKLGDSNA